MADHIGSRVAERIRTVFPDRLHKEIAAAVDMTPDAFSRALKGHRAFSAVELAALADELDVDLYWMITGREDPNKVLVAARHDYDPQSGHRDVPGRSSDEQTLRDIGLAYQQAYQDVDHASSSLPKTPAELRRALGDDFVRPFVQRLESHLGVDVVRVSGLSTSYCLSIAGRIVIVIAATGNWFRENWSIGHELGHAAEGHLSEPRDGRAVQRDEARANAFAAEILMPLALMRSMDWREVSAEELAARIWELGVSTDAVRRRLNGLGIAPSARVDRLLNQPTQRLLRQHWSNANQEPDLITIRMEDASTRRFPVSLQEAHVKAVATGSLGPATLAWMLDIDPQDLEVDEPPSDHQLTTAELAAELGLQA